MTREEEVRKRNRLLADYSNDVQLTNAVVEISVTLAMIYDKLCEKESEKE